jgi:hypothetical protein
MIRSVSKRLNATIVHNIGNTSILTFFSFLDKMKIPFLILVAIILILEILGSLGRSRIIGLGDDAFTLSAIFQLVVIWCITAYFFYVGFRFSHIIKKLTNRVLSFTRSTALTNRTRKLNRVSVKKKTTF